jgi:hypothetical protein
MDWLEWMFFGPARLLAAWSWSGVLIAAALALAQAIRAGIMPVRGFLKSAPVFAAMLWLVFTAYELQVGALGARFTGGVRIDLLVLVPILYVLTGAALLSLTRAYKPENKTPDLPG